MPQGRRVRDISRRFQPGVAQTTGTTSTTSTTSTSKASEAEEEIDRSPVPVLQKSRPEVPRRPIKSRPEQQGQTPPPSPQDEFHPRRRERSQTPTPQRQPDRPPTPENSTLSTNHHLMDDSSASVNDVQRQLSSLKIEVQILREELDSQREVEASLRRDLDSAVAKYDEAIYNLQKSKDETNELQDQVERLRRELDRERRIRKELEDEIYAKIKREGELLDMLEKARKMAQTSVEDSMIALTAVNKQETNEPRQAAPRKEDPRANERQKSTHIHRVVHEKPESKMDWDPNFNFKNFGKARSNVSRCRDSRDSKSNLNDKAERRKV